MTQRCWWRWSDSDFMHTLATSELSSVIDLSSCYWGLCSKWGATMPLSIPQILLHCPPWFYYREIIGEAQRCSEEISVLLSRIWWIGASPASLSRQHSLVHYADNICLFSAPNRLCSLITEAKHIKTVKEPWWRMNHIHPLNQILYINQCLDKLYAMRIDFTNQGMLEPMGLWAMLDIVVCVLYLPFTLQILFWEYRTGDACWTRELW